MKPSDYPIYYSVPTISEKEDALISLRLGELCYYRTGSFATNFGDIANYDKITHCEKYLDNAIKQGDFYPEVYFYKAQACKKYNYKETNYKCRLNNYILLEQKEGENGLYYNRYDIKSSISGLNKFFSEIQPK